MGGLLVLLVNLNYLCVQIQTNYKMKDYDYETTVKLKHHEAVAKIDLRTGEVKKIQEQKNNIPEGKIIFEPEGIFRKDYTNSWTFLQKKLRPIEFKVAFTLALMAKANTNTLEPLNDETTIPELIEILNISKNMVKPILEKLWNLGVYGKFEVRDMSKPYTKYWIFNPYLSFSGRLLQSDIASLFSGTECAKAFRDPEYN
jgi:hypothetical protein